MTYNVFGGTLNLTQCNKRRRLLYLITCHQHMRLKDCMGCVTHPCPLDIFERVLVVCSTIDQSLAENMSDNEVFTSVTSSPWFHTKDSKLRSRRVTVGCQQSSELQSCFSTGDIPSLLDRDTDRKSRPKSFFPHSGNELMNWRPPQKSDSSDLSDSASRAGTASRPC